MDFDNAAEVQKQQVWKVPGINKLTDQESGLVISFAQYHGCSFVLLLPFGAGTCQ